MSRKKKEQIRLEFALRGIRQQYYALVDRIIHRRYNLYKKAHLERKRRYRLRQKRRDEPYNEFMFISFRCCGCRFLTERIHTFWGYLFCTECLYNPFVIQKAVNETVSQAKRKDPSIIESLQELEKRVSIIEETKKENNPFLKELKDHKETLKESLQYCLRIFPQLLPKK